MTHPYQRQPPKPFWRKAVSAVHPLDISGWYDRKFSLEGCKIATAGSCFAQHIGRHLQKNGFDYLDMEPPPPGLPREVWGDFSYGLYSARYGNIYTSRQLVQLVKRATGVFSPLEDVWIKGDGVVDPFRPTLEPEPFSSVAELQDLRRHHLDGVAALLGKADVFVFTLGLTEAWLSRRDGAAFPLCPGTAGGQFDADLHQFHNLTAAEVRQDMLSFMAAARSINPRLRFLLTVSPVPLMATATAQHVAVATSHSKAVLRTVAGELAQELPYVDYFPSYDIITAPVMKGYFFQPDGREVSEHDVNHVMSVFFQQHPPVTRASSPEGVSASAPLSEAVDRVKCDEELLDTFGES